MLEIEQKYQQVDHAELEQRLATMGMTEWVDHEEADHYINAPDRDFKVTGEAFRLRRIGDQNFLTYKGPRIDQEVKIRPELEIAIREGETAAEEMMQLLGHLGYRSVAIVRKRRKEGKLQRQGYTIGVCLDDVDQLGEFAEVEIVAPEDQKDAARKVLLELAEELGLEHVQPRSYLSLFLEKTGKE